MSAFLIHAHSHVYRYEGSGFVAAWHSWRFHGIMAYAAAAAAIHGSAVWRQRIEGSHSHTGQGPYFGGHWETAEGYPIQTPCQQRASWLSGPKDRAALDWQREYEEFLALHYATPQSKASKCISLQSRQRLCVFSNAAISTEMVLQMKEYSRVSLTTFVWVEISFNARI